MTAPPTWPDRTLYSALVQSPATCFTTPDLQASTFALDRRGSVMAWSGGRAIVFRAEHPSGQRTAVRFMLRNDDAAGHRYDMLSRHLATNPVESFVGTHWIEDGLHIGPKSYPLLLMDWIDGLPLDRHVAQDIASGASPTHLHQLSEAWQRSCRSLVAAQIGHGDVHAGNTLVHVPEAGQPELRLVDYDNVWVPGLHIPSKEAGHPAFQHPGAGARDLGPYMDAFPNTLTYLSLAGLATDPGLWQHRHDSDDCLLFHRDDLQTPDSPIWT